MLRGPKGIKLAPSISQCDTPPCYGTGRGERVILDFVTVTIDIFLTPPSFGHLPYILQCKTQRRSLRISSIVRTKITRHATGYGKGGV